MEKRAKFYFSAKQKTAFLGCPDSHHRTFAKLDDGQVVEYTTASELDHDHGTDWDDIKYLGTGIYSHST